MPLKEDDIDKIRPGVLNKEQITKLSENKIITKVTLGDADPSSFDLHLSNQGWKMKGSIKPNRDTDCAEITKTYHLDAPLDLNNLTTLETGTTYIIQIEEGFKPPPRKKLFGRATGKSSIGRLDVLTRLIVDKCPYYDKVDDEHSGSLYLEVTPITFPIKVKKGIALNQLRLFRGLPEWNEIKKEEIELFGALILDEEGELKETGLISELRVNLSPDKQTGFSAYRAKKGNGNKDLEIDLTKPNEHYKPEDFWEPIPFKKGEPLEIKPEAFYILRSKERFRLPKDVAVYCQAISETLGELRIHYAGFVHPGFGTWNDEGTPVIFEVRGHNVTTYLHDKETLANINFYRMSEFATPEKSQYDEQELQLSKYFKKWGQT